MRPFVMQRLLLARTEAEIIELTRHGFVAFQETEDQPQRLVGFSAIEIYGPKLAELQCLAVDTNFQGSGVGRQLVEACVDCVDVPLAVAGADAVHLRLATDRVPHLATANQPARLQS